MGRLAKIFECKVRKYCSKICIFTAPRENRIWIRNEPAIFRVFPVFAHELTKCPPVILCTSALIPRVIPPLGPAWGERRCYPGYEIDEILVDYNSGRCNSEACQEGLLVFTRSVGSRSNYFNFIFYYCKGVLPYDRRLEYRFMIWSGT